MPNEILTQKSILVRDWDCKNFREITVDEFKKAEDAARTSAFAETKAVSSNGFVVWTEMKVEEFIEYRNA